MTPKRRSPRAKPTPTPLDAQQRALLDEQEKLRKRMEKLQRIIEEAPSLAEAQDKLRREELLSRSMQPARRRNRAAVLEDKRYIEATIAPAASAGRPRRRRSRRTEERQAKLIFFALLLGLACVLFWLWSVWGR